MGVVCSKDSFNNDRNSHFLTSELLQQSSQNATILQTGKCDSYNLFSTSRNQKLSKEPKCEFGEPPKPCDLEIQIFHSKFDNYQIEYFNKKELEYYRKILKNEEQSQDKRTKQKSINCQEDKLLGCGSFGTVTLGYDVNNLRIMAVKRVYIGSSPESSTALREIKEESKLLSELKHKNIVTYYGSEKEKEFLKIYMEFVEGGSIASLIKTYGSFPEKVAARYTKQILEGLEYLHYHNVVHRDIKGANVLVTRNGIVKLSDFGSANEFVHMNNR